MQTSPMSIVASAATDGFKKKGLGRRLLNVCLDEAKRLGCRTLRLDSQTKLEAAVRLYRAHGFTEIPRYNDNPRADIWMERVL